MGAARMSPPGSCVLCVVRRQTADRQNRQQPPKQSDTSAGESPTQRHAVVPLYRPTHQGGAFVRSFRDWTKIRMV